MKVRHSAFLLLLVLAAGCGGEGAPADEAAMAGEQPAMEEAAEPMSMEAPTGPVDAALASEGEGYFQSKGCVGCHTIGEGRLTGPDLQGVTERRQFDWVIAMIVRPDSMLQNDDAAKELLAEYMTPMVNMGVTSQEARAMYEYLRQ
jgi:mono/diheme cytochrome c family protein